MKRNTCWKIAIILSAVLLLTVCGCSDKGSQIIAQGKVDNLRWAVDDGGCLSFTGTGAIPGVEYVFNTSTGMSDNVYPDWYSHRDSISRVVIGSGIDSISMNAFMYFPALRQIDVAATVGSIDGYAVTGCTALERVVIRGSAVEMEKYCIGFTGGTADRNLSEVVFEGIPGSQVESYAEQCQARFDRL